MSSCTLKLERFYDNFALDKKFSKTVETHCGKGSERSRFSQNLSSGVFVKEKKILAGHTCKPVARQHSGGRVQSGSNKDKEITVTNNDIEPNENDDTKRKYGSLLNSKDLKE